MKENKIIGFRLKKDEHRDYFRVFKNEQSLRLQCGEIPKEEIEKVEVRGI